MADPSQSALLLSSKYAKLDLAVYKSALAASGKTEADLCRAVGVKMQTYHFWTTTNPGVRSGVHALRLARALGISVRTLFGVPLS